MKPILKVSGLMKHFEGFRLGTVSFELPKGCILGLIGENGCGKTTLLRMILGSYRAGKEDAGEITIDGIQNGDPKEYLKKLAFVLNETPFEKGLNAAEQGKFYGHYYPSFQMERYQQKLKEFEVPAKLAVGRMSRGEQIRQQLAFALSYDAKLYVMDEPAGFLDMTFREEFYRQVRRLTEDEEKSVIFASHLIEELEGFCDMFLWLSRRQKNSMVSFFGTVDELREQYRMVEGGRDILQQLQRIDPHMIAGSKMTGVHGETLIRYKKQPELEALRDSIRYPDLKEIFYYVEKIKRNASEEGGTIMSKT